MHDHIPDLPRNRRHGLAISYLILIVLLSLAGCQPLPPGPPEGVLRVMTYSLNS